MKSPIALALVLALAVPVFADGPTVTVPSSVAAPSPTPAGPSKESVDKLLSVMNVETMVNAMQNRANTAVQGGMQRTLRAQVSTPEQQKVIDELSKKITADIAAQLSWENMKPLYSQVYTETFTQEEIDGLVQFYQSPIGKVFVSKVPQVMDKTQILMQSRITPLMRNLQSEVAQSAKQIQDLKPKPMPTAVPAPAAVTAPTTAPKS
ncbi:MAG TPA: DUF2059 domain-containing protein [Opitutaceae bacterium]|jgi:hypothetical protein|nr:DUF2059 domain-containing protein [Opitutaceae bacterium]